MEFTAREKYLIALLVEMVLQNCTGSMCKPDEYYSGCISTHFNAMKYLVELGIMECIYPEEMEDDYPWRHFNARLVPGWEEKVYDDDECSNEQVVPKHGPTIAP